MTIAKTSQVSLEVVYQGNPNAKTSQVALEALVSGGAKARTSQLAVEIICPANDPVHVTVVDGTFEFRSLPSFQVNRPGVLLIPDPGVLGLAGGVPAVKIVIKPKAQSAIQM